MDQEELFRDAYLRGVRAAIEETCPYIPQPILLAILQWSSDLDCWKTGEPPPPPSEWVIED
ncbi:hypothetical protein [Sphingomonas daechungensis]|uniref:hypothetical protein n=1 Tax=Sphingomonas daechungensis TaxID=1176646 RepID=UPI0031E7AA3C